MSEVYLKILEELLRESKDQSDDLDDLPDEDVISDGLLLKDENGFKLEITKVGKSKKTGNSKKRIQDCWFKNWTNKKKYSQPKRWNKFQQVNSKI